MENDLNLTNLTSEDKLGSIGSNYSSQELLRILGPKLEINFNIHYLFDNNSIELPHPLLQIQTNQDNINFNGSNNSIKNKKLHMFTIIKSSNDNLLENKNTLINKTNYLKYTNKE